MIMSSTAVRLSKAIPAKFLIVAIAALAVSIGTDVACAAAPAKKATSAKPAGPIGHVVDYTELENHVGAEVVIETTLGTVRRGTLVKYTNPGLTLQLGPEHGSIDLSVPRETVRSASVMDATAPVEDAAGADSAKKN